MSMKTNKTEAEHVVQIVLGYIFSDWFAQGILFS